MVPQSETIGGAIYPVSISTNKMESIPICVCVKIGEFLDNGGVENYSLYNMKSLFDFLELLRVTTKNSEKLMRLPERLDIEEVIELMRCYKQNDIYHFMRELMFKTYNIKENLKIKFILKNRRKNPKKELLTIEYTINRKRKELYENKKQKEKRMIKSYKIINNEVKVKQHMINKKSKK